VVVAQAHAPTPVAGQGRDFVCMYRIQPVRQGYAARSVGVVKSFDVFFVQIPPIAMTTTSKIDRDHLSRLQKFDERIKWWGLSQP
jgi:hypothetical protein